MKKSKSQNDESAAKKKRSKNDEVQGRARALKAAPLTTVPRDNTTVPRDNTTVPRDQV